VAVSRRIRNAPEIRITASGRLPKAAVDRLRRCVTLEETWAAMDALVGDGLSSAIGLPDIDVGLETRYRFNSVVNGGEPGFAEVPQGG
jgi:hypothetical protein